MACHTARPPSTAGENRSGIQNISGKTQLKFNSPPTPRATSIPTPGKKTAAVKARNAPKAARMAKSVMFFCISVRSLMLLLNLLHEDQ